LTTGLRWSNHEEHEDGIRRSAESNERLCDRGLRAPRAGTTLWHRTLLSLIASCASSPSLTPLRCERRSPARTGRVHRSRRSGRETMARSLVPAFCPRSSERSSGLVARILWPANTMPMSSTQAKLRLSGASTCVPRQSVTSVRSRHRLRSY
jgi:hypothetical protein